MHCSNDFLSTCIARMLYRYCTLYIIVGYHYRYSMVMIYYVFCLITMMLIRPALSAAFVNYKGTPCIYAALYFLPILTVLHSVLAGLICK